MIRMKQQIATLILRENPVETNVKSEFGYVYKTMMALLKAFDISVGGGGDWGRRGSRGRGVVM